MFASSVSLANLLMTTVIGANIGLPFGLPPQTEDPFMARVAPDECLVYLTWSGSATPDASSQNQFEQLLAEPEVQLLLSELDLRIKRSVTELAEAEGPRAEFAAREIMKWTRILLSKPAAMFLSKIRGTPDGPDIQAGLVAGVNDKAGELQQLFETLQDEQLRDRLKAVTIRGAKMYRLSFDDDAPAVTFGVKDKYFYAAVGQGTLEGMLDRADTAPPNWLNQLHNQTKLERTSLRFYLNAKSVIAQIKPLLFLVAGFDTDEILQAVGLGNLKSVACTTGLDETRYVSHWQVQFNGPLTGVLGAAVGQPLSADDLAPVPSDATFAVAARVEIQKMLDAFLEVLGSIDADIPEELLEELGEAEEELGFHIRDDLINSLGDTLCLYHSPGEGGLLAGFAAVLRVQNRKKLARVLDELMDRANEAADAHDARGPRLLGQLRFGGHDIHFLNPPDDDIPVSPAWCLTDSELIVSPFPQNIKAYLSRSQDYQSLAHVPQVKTLFQSGQAPLKIVYQNTPALFDLAYPIVQILAHYVAEELREEGIDIDISLLPSGKSIRQHLQPDIIAVVHSTSGLEVTSRESVPGSGCIALLPLVVAVAMESHFDFDDLLEELAAVLDPGRARQQQSMNNLRQIAIAMHNYHEVYGHLPAAYSTDDDARPLLSWRVHILPFVDELPLYQRFHLDESWDSRHNRALIPLMPKVYFAPGSKAGEGRTNYVTLRDERTIFPGKEEISFRHILDGTSMTIMTVEASDTAAVIWTKPDDLKLDPMNPLRRLIGLRKERFLAGFADGHVRSISESIDHESLRAAFTRDGREANRIP